MCTCFVFVPSFAAFDFAKCKSCFYNWSKRRTCVILWSPPIWIKFWHNLLTNAWIDSNASSVKNPTMWYFSSTFGMVCAIRWCIFIVTEILRILTISFANSLIFWIRSNCSDLKRSQEAQKTRVILFQRSKTGLSVLNLHVVFLLLFHFHFYLRTRWSHFWTIVHSLSSAKYNPLH